jgi:uncharacterized protein (DUF1684 family)
MSTRAAVAEAVADWERWREQRAASVSAPHGPLALAGTYWLDDLADGTIPGLPGRWRQEGGAVVHDTDGAGAALETDGRPLLLPEGRKILAIEREGLLAVRVWDPLSPARQAFAGIDAFGWDERWVVPAVFRPFGEDRTVRVPNADGRERGLGLGGELSLTVDGAPHTLSVTVQDDGRLWAVLADGTSGKTSFRFRFLYAPEPAADGSLTVDLNRTVLPPCAFADAFICPFPPPGNTLPFALEAGERGVLTN